MLQKSGWDQSLARWRAFWAGSLLDRPPVLVHLVATEGLDVGQSASLESTLAHYDPLQNGPQIESAEISILNKAAAIHDDLPPTMTAGGGVWFTGAVMGAPLVSTAEMLTCHPIISEWDALTSIRYSPTNEWAQRALQLAHQLVDRSGGRYAVTPGLLEGPSDICANLRSPTRFACDLYEYPTEVRRLAEIAADAWLQHTRALYDMIPLYDGGTVTQWSLWVPGRGVALQEDFCSIISPRLYREFFLSLDRELADQADITWMHIHSGAIHLVDEVLTVEQIRGIQIVNDGVAGPPIAKVLPVMQRIQQRGKCLIVRKYAPRELEQILPHLAPKGLAVDTYSTSISTANAWLEHLTPWPYG